MLRDIGTPATALRQIHERLNVALSVVRVCAVALKAQAADYDIDVGLSLQRCVAEVIDSQMDLINNLIEGGAV